MRVDTLTSLIVALVVFYQRIVRPRRYRVALAKCLLGALLCVPAVALMSAEWRDNAQANATVAVLASTFFWVPHWVIFLLNPQAAWSRILGDVALLMAVTGVTAVGMTHWVADDGLEMAHFWFAWRMPGIVARYVVRLPWDGPADAARFFKVFAAGASRGLSLSSAVTPSKSKRIENVVGNMTLN